MFIIGVNHENKVKTNNTSNLAESVLFYKFLFYKKKEPEIFPAQKK